MLLLGLIAVQSFAQTAAPKPKKPAVNEQKEISPAVQIYFETNKSVIKPAELAKFYHGNAARFYGIPMPKAAG